MRAEDMSAEQRRREIAELLGRAMRRLQEPVVKPTPALGAESEQPQASTFITQSAQAL